MANIVRGKVVWHEKWANNPDIEVQFDRRFPEISEFRYQQRDELWWAELDGFVSFFSWRGPHNNEGFSGRPFLIKTTDDRKVELLGPWSSRPSAMNLAGFPPCLELVYVEDGCRIQGYMLVSELEKQTSKIEVTPFDGNPFASGSKIVLVNKIQYGEPLWIPAVRLPDGSTFMKRV